jgi:hypothetical protein
MADMPKMQEHFSATARDGGHAANAGAICCARPWMADVPKMQEHFSA